MGSVRMGPPEDLVLLLRDDLEAHTFIETGTYLGATTRWAAAHFTEVHSVEMDKALYEAASKDLADLSNVELHHGDSCSSLPRIMKKMVAPAVLWLDAHWSGGPTAGAADECPLLKEVEDLNQQKTQHAILIDDARLFMAPPPTPHSVEQWPKLAQVLEALTKLVPRYVVIHEDVIIAVPMSSQTVVIDYCRKKELDNARSSVALKDGARTFIRGLRQIYRSL